MKEELQYVMPLHPSAFRLHPSKVGPDGLEPSPARVRTECAAANTLIPCCSPWGRRDSNPRRAR